MPKRLNLTYVMRGLIEAAHPIADRFNVPVQTLVLAMLSVLKPKDAGALLEASKFFEPLQAQNLVADSPRYKHLLTLIERDNPALYKKLTGLD